MLNAIRYAREKNVPYFGICLGMQTACIEFARNVCGLKDANSSEFDPATPASRHLQAARTARRGRDGRHHAPGRVDLHPAGRFAGVPAPTAAQPRSASATAIATSSTASTKRCSPAAACASPAPRPTRPTSRSSRFPAIPTSSAASSTPSSSRSRWSRIRSSASSSPPATGTACSGRRLSRWRARLCSRAGANPEIKALGGSGALTVAMRGADAMASH